MKYNPFNPNSVVATNLFVGRSQYIMKVIRKLEQVRRGMSSSFFLFGERGIRKTALAKISNLYGKMRFKIRALILNV